MTLVFTHPSASAHLTPPGHPEQVARMQAVMSGLKDVRVDWREAPLAAESDLLRCHPQGYLDRIRAAIAQHEITMLDGDTYTSTGGQAAALHAVGGVCAAVDAVLAGQAPNAFVAMRPPGHHAERETPMGFCVYGSVAIAAKRALDHHGLGRVAVLDFDVHHGNGTQDLLWDEPRAFFASSHQMPLFPGTGKTSEVGEHGKMMNLPLAPGTDGDEAQRGWRAICAQMERFRPELVLISAGFDAHRADPLASLAWDEGDFTTITRMICDAAALCSAPVVSALEGGYDLDALGRSVRAHVDVLTEVA